MRLNLSEKREGEKIIVTDKDIHDLAILFSINEEEYDNVINSLFMYATLNNLTLKIGNRDFFENLKEATSYLNECVEREIQCIIRKLIENTKRQEEEQVSKLLANTFNNEEIKEAIRKLKNNDTNLNKKQTKPLTTFYYLANEKILKTLNENIEHVKEKENSNDLKELAVSGDISQRYAVACNTNTTVEILYQLVNDRILYIRRAAIKSIIEILKEQTPDDIIKLALEEGSETQRTLALYTNNLTLLKLLSKSPFRTVRIAVIENRATSADILLAMLNRKERIDDLRNICSRLIDEGYLKEVINFFNEWLKDLQSSTKNRKYKQECKRFLLLVKRLGFSLK